MLLASVGGVCAGVQVGLLVPHLLLRLRLRVLCVEQLLQLLHALVGHRVVQLGQQRRQLARHGGEALAVLAVWVVHLLLQRAHVAELALQVAPHAVALPQRLQHVHLLVAQLRRLVAAVVGACIATGRSGGGFRRWRWRGAAGDFEQRQEAAHVAHEARQLP